MLKAVYLADWMVNAIRAPGTYVAEFEELEQLVLSLAHRFGFENVVDVGSRSSQVFAKDTFHDTLQRFIDDYDEEVFWDGLIDRLPDREFAATYGDDAKGMSDAERVAKWSTIRDRYEVEVEKHGMERLVWSANDGG